jgi:molybdopterin molybdotransferase
MITVDEARRYVLGGCQPLAPQELTIDEVVGCVLAETVVSTVPVAPFDNSAVDGFAFRSGSTGEAPARLVVAGQVMAGGQSGRPAQPGEAVRVMTGAPIPAGTDSVCMLEHAGCDPDANTVFMADADALAVLGDGDGTREGGPIDLWLLDPDGVAGDRDEDWELGWDRSVAAAPPR